MLGLLILQHNSFHLRRSQGQELSKEMTVHMMSPNIRIYTTLAFSIKDSVQPTLSWVLEALQEMDKCLA